MSTNKKIIETTILELKGKTITNIDIDEYRETVTFITSDGEVFELYYPEKFVFVKLPQG